MIITVYRKWRKKENKTFEIYDFLIPFYIFCPMVLLWKNSAKLQKFYKHLTGLRFFDLFDPFIVRSAKKYADVKSVKRRMYL